jgi:CelD/BcsL family acetyltransferase involved in cellulose biosynthesis
MDYLFAHDKYETLAQEWSLLQEESSSSVIFSTPQWSGTWWKHFGTKCTSCLCSLRKGNRLIGVAPLAVSDGAASFAGSPDVCDYLDFTVRNGHEDTFCTILLDNLIAEGIKQLDFGAVRPDSIVVTHLIEQVKERGLTAACNQEDVSVSLDLPSKWEQYLQELSNKQRHELKRKFRRLKEMGTITQLAVTDTSAEAVEIFFRLFRECRADKAEFLTPTGKLLCRKLSRLWRQQAVCASH